MKTPTSPSNPDTNANLPPDAPTGKIIVVTAGIGQGGVGKTTLATDFIDYCADKGEQTTKLDLDESGKSQGSLHAFHPDAIRAPLSGNLGLNAVLDALDSEYRYIVADLGASTTEATGDWFDLVHSDVAALGHRFIALAAITPDAASLEGLMRWQAAVGKRVNYVVAKIPMPKNTPFYNWELSPEELETEPKRELAPKVLLFKATYNPVVLTMPFRDPILQQLIRRHSVTISRIASGDHTVDELKTTRYRILAQGIHRKMTAEFNKLARLLDLRTSAS